MRILTRYLLREFIVPLTYCLIGFFGIYVVFELFESFSRLIEAKPPFYELFTYFAGYISPYLEWLIAGALLLATLYTIWRFCRYHEITAMRASGISFLAIVKPLLGVALIMALIVAGINEFYTPYAAERSRDFRDARFKELPGNIHSNIPYYNQPDNRVWRINRINPNNPNTIEGARISFDRPDGSRKLDITCLSAAYLDGMWWLSYPQYQYFDEFNMPIENPHPELSHLTLRAMPELSETPRDFMLMNKAWEFYSTRDMIHYIKAHPNLNQEEFAGKVFDIHAHLAAPFSCLVITLFAIPAGVATGRQSVFKGILSAIAMFFGFYALSIVAMILAKNGWTHPVLSAWTANAVFLVIGIVMFYRQR